MSGVRRAMILAAGRGERMRPLTDHTPKPLLAVRGRPLIEWTILGLRSAGLVNLVINHAHLGEQIVTTLGDGSRLGVSIRYSPESEALETAGGIAHALPLLGDGPFVVTNADVFSDFDYSRLARRELGSDLAYLVLVDNPTHHAQGDFSLANQRVSEPRPGQSTLTFSGIGIYSQYMFNTITDGSRVPLAPLLRAAMHDGRVGGERHAGFWSDVGTPERLAALNQA